MGKNYTYQRGKLKKRKTCKKIRYRTEENAQAQADKINVEIKLILGQTAHRVPLERPYRCDTCGDWHIGRKVTNGVWFGQKGEVYVRR